MREPTAGNIIKLDHGRLARGLGGKWSEIEPNITIVVLTNILLPSQDCLVLTPDGSIVRIFLFRDSDRIYSGTILE